MAVAVGGDQGDTAHPPFPLIRVAGWRPRSASQGLVADGSARKGGSTLFDEHCSFLQRSAHLGVGDVGGGWYESGDHPVWHAGAAGGRGMFVLDTSNGDQLRSTTSFQFR